MKYKSGSFKLQEGQWLKGAFALAETSHPATRSATISVDELRGTHKDVTPIFAITPDQLRAAYFDSKAEKNSEIVQRMTRSGCHYAESLMPKDQAAAAPQLFVAWLFTRGRISRAVEHLAGRHLCNWFGKRTVPRMKSYSRSRIRVLFGKSEVVRRTTMAGNWSPIQPVMNKLRPTQFPSTPFTLGNNLVLNLPTCDHENAWETAETIDLWFVDRKSVG